MSETWQTTLFLVFGGAILTLIGSIVGFAFTYGNRLVKLETSYEFLIDSVGRLAAKKLHSPDDHLGIDKYLDSYINHHHDMSMKEWMELKVIVTSTIINLSATKVEKAYAEFLSELCDHKCMIPVYNRKVSK